MGGPNMSKDSEVYLGVDVSKESVDICALSAEGRVLSRKQGVPRTAAAIQAAVRRSNRNALAVWEATGGLEKAAARALEAVGSGKPILGLQWTDGFATPALRNHRWNQRVRPPKRLHWDVDSALQYSSTFSELFSRRRWTLGLPPEFCVYKRPSGFAHLDIIEPRERRQAFAR